MIRFTSSPAILPASFVAWRCASLKYAGTVMTARSTASPKNGSAPFLRSGSMEEETCGGQIVRFAQNESGNFRRREYFVAEPHANDVAAGRIEAKWKQFQLVLNV